MQSELESKINYQRAFIPKFMDREMFRMVALLITHSAIELTSFELDLAKKGEEEISLGISENKAPMGEGYTLECKLTTRYGLPCRCWLYLCIALDVPLPISLIHPLPIF